MLLLVLDNSSVVYVSFSVLSASVHHFLSSSHLFIIIIIIAIISNIALWMR